MGFNINNKKRSRLNSDINVTPFVDVMLVLLVIFMVTTPMMMSGIDVDLPESNMNQLATNDDPIVISLTKEGKIYLQDNLIENNENLIKKLYAINQENKKTQILIMGDEHVVYGKVMELFGYIRSAGIENVSLVTEGNN